MQGLVGSSLAAPLNIAGKGDSCVLTLHREKGKAQRARHGERRRRRHADVVRALPNLRCLGRRQDGEGGDGGVGEGCYEACSFFEY